MNEELNGHFAAANGYGGFRSYFPIIFDSKRYQRVFVLKGGPGTGKSTLMRKIGNFGCENGFTVTSVFCSSDPSSLDGVILENAGKKVAVLDGTSPHEKDAIYPGVIDTLVNLGDHFSEELLTEKRKEILFLCEKKSVAYKKAYAYLQLAGTYFDRLSSFHDTVKSQYEKPVSLLLKNAEYGEKNAFLCRAFCKYGLLSAVPFPNAKHVVRLEGDDFQKADFMRELTAKIEKKSVHAIVCPSPLSQEQTDAVYLHGCDILITAVGNFSPSRGENTILLKNKRERHLEVDLYRECHDQLLLRAETQLSEASRLHAELEKIYKNAVDFSKNDAVCSWICARISDILSKP